MVNDGSLAWMSMVRPEDIAEAKRYGHVALEHIEIEGVDYEG